MWNGLFLKYHQEIIIIFFTLLIKLSIQFSGQFHKIHKIQVFDTFKSWSRFENDIIFLNYIPQNWVLGGRHLCIFNVIPLIFLEFNTSKCSKSNYTIESMALTITFMISTSSVIPTIYMIQIKSYANSDSTKIFFFCKYTIARNYYSDFSID